MVASMRESEGSQSYTMRYTLRLVRFLALIPAVLVQANDAEAIKQEYREGSPDDPKFTHYVSASRTRGSSRRRYLVLIAD